MKKFYTEAFSQRRVLVEGGSGEGGREERDRQTDRP